MGPSGSGKTFTALRIAPCLGERVALIDTEHGSAAKYADVFNFDTLSIEGDYHPKRFAEALEAAVAGGYDVVIIDGITPEWDGVGGILDLKQDMDRQKPKDSFQNWAAMTRLHDRFIEAMLATPLHLIVTMRSKMTYALGANDAGKTAVTKLGMEPIQRTGIEYNFDFIGDMGLDHVLVVQKTRCPTLDGLSMAKPGEDLGNALRDWLTDGVAMPVSRKRAEEVAALIKRAKAALAGDARDKLDGLMFELGNEHKTWKATDVDKFEADVEKLMATAENGTGEGTG